MNTDDSVNEEDPPAMMPEGLFDVLVRSRQLGFLGPGPVADHVAHADIYRIGLESLVGAGAHIVDIGAGGGVPSLPLLVSNDGEGMAATWSMVLADAGQKRCSFLTWAVAELGLADRVSVEWARIEEWAHRPEARFGFDGVIARGFGPPAITVECGAALLGDGGHLLISEPPGLRSWPKDGLAELGLVQVEVGGPDGEPLGLAAFRRDISLGALADYYPRPFKQQRSRPVFTVVPDDDEAG